jgi:hypothetical protein
MLMPLGSVLGVLPEARDFEAGFMGLNLKTLRPNCQYPTTSYILPLLSVHVWPVLGVETPSDAKMVRHPLE